MRDRVMVAVLALAVLAVYPAGVWGQKKESKNPAAGVEEPGGEEPEEGRGAELGDLEKAAEAGDSRALFLLGVRHYEGEDGFEKSPERAAEYFERSSERGFFPAGYSLGLLYFEGEGVEQSDEKAAELFIGAADFGYAPAQSMLGALFEDGRGVEQDDVEAYKWYRRASWQGDPQAQTSLGFFYANGKGGVEVDYRKSTGYFREAAEEGFAPAQTSLGQAYYEGKGVKQDFEAAREWYQKAAEQGHLWGLNNLAWLQATCEDEKVRDGAKAVDFAKRAIEGGGDERFEILDTLAAALARNGEFEEAAKVQERAIAALGAEEGIEGDEKRELTEEFEARLEMYGEDEAYVEPAPEPVDEPEEEEKPKDDKPEKPKKGRVVA